jgi:hypothetical protein
MIQWGLGEKKIIYVGVKELGSKNKVGVREEIKKTENEIRGK